MNPNMSPTEPKTADEKKKPTVIRSDIANNFDVTEGKYYTWRIVYIKLGRHRNHKVYTWAPSDKRSPEYQ